MALGLVYTLSFGDLKLLCRLAIVDFYGSYIDLDVNAREVCYIDSFNI